MKVRARLLVSRHVHDSKSHSVRNRGSMPSTSLTVHNVLNDNDVSVPIASGNTVEIETAFSNILNNNILEVRASETATDLEFVT